MELVKFKIEVLESYTVSQLMVTKENLNIALESCRKLKDIYMDIRDTENAIGEEKNILRICENLDSIDKVLTLKEGDVMVFTDYGSFCLN